MIFVTHVCRPPLLDQHQVERVYLVKRQYPRRRFNCDRFERLTDAKNLITVGRREAAYNKLLARTHLKQPLGVEELQRLPDRRL